MSAEPQNQSNAEDAISAWRITKWLCCGVVVASVSACVVMAAIRSNGLTQVKITALDPAKEPRDHRLPLIKSRDALPDYELIVQLNNGRKISLGAKPNTSAKDGLSWTLNEPLSVAEVAGVRLQEQDKFISDAITEVQLVRESVAADDYRFDFTIERSASVGLKSFFQTPIGKAISGAFFLALLLILAAAIAG